LGISIARSFFFYQGVGSPGCRNKGVFTARRFFLIKKGMDLPNERLLLALFNCRGRDTLTSSWKMAELGFLSARKTRENEK
jgi:hypothetical protein